MYFLNFKGFREHWKRMCVKRELLSIVLNKTLRTILLPNLPVLKVFSNLVFGVFLEFQRFQRALETNVCVKHELVSIVLNKTLRTILLPNLPVLKVFLNLVLSLSFEFPRFQRELETNVWNMNCQVSFWVKRLGQFFFLIYPFWSVSFEILWHLYQCDLF